MSADLHLFKRGSIYYWRRRIPRSFASGFGSTHLLLSLRERESTAARRLGRRLSVVFDKAMQAIELEQRVPTPQEQQEILKQLYRMIVDRCDEEAASYYVEDEIPLQGRAKDTEDCDPSPPAQSDAPTIPKQPESSFDNAASDTADWDECEVVDDDEEDTRRPSALPVPVESGQPLTANEAEYLAYLDDYYMYGNPKEMAEAFQKHLLENRLMPVRDLLEPILAKYRIEAANDTIAFRRFLRDATAFAALAFEDASQRAAGADTSGEVANLLESARREARFIVPVVVKDAPARSQASFAVTTSMLADDDDPDCLLHAPLSECIAGYVRSKAGKKWAEKQAKDSAPISRLMINHFGDVQASRIRKTGAMRYRDALARVPTQTRLMPFKGLPMAEMVAKADAIEQGLASSDPAFVEYGSKNWIVDGKVDRFSLKTQDKYILFAHGLFEYILDTAPIDVLLRNPFDKLLHGEETIKARRGEVRVAWSMPDIQRLLQSPVWAGSRSEWFRAEPGKVVTKDDRYWIPLICLFAGLRLGEACQLKARDFELVDGAAFIFVRRGRGQKVKNASSVRAVPVHQKLIAGGLLEYVEQRRVNDEEWLFPVTRTTIRRRRKIDRVSPDEFSRWFGTYRKSPSVGIGDDEHDFHSLRHTFITYLKNQGVVLDIVQALIGHKGRRTATDDYFHGYEPTVLQAALQALDYGIDLPASN